MIDQGEEKLWQPDQCVNRKGMLSAARVKSVFVRLIREAVQDLPVDYGRYCFNCFYWQIDEINKNKNIDGRTCV